MPNDYTYYLASSAHIVFFICKKILEYTEFLSKIRAMPMSDPNPTQCCQAFQVQHMKCLNIMSHYCNNSQSFTRFAVSVDERIKDG